MVVPVATVCADSNDFTTSGGRLKLRRSQVQNEVEAFNWTLDGVQDVYEDIVPFDDIVIPLDGWYFVTMDVRANALITRANSGITVSAAIVAQLRLNDVAIPGTETKIIHNSQGQAVTTEPTLRLESTGSCTRFLNLSAGDRLSIWAKRNADPGTTCEVISDADGRCRITAIRYGG